MDEKLPVVINIEPKRLIDVLKIITEVSSGEISPLFIEERIRELQECVPFLPRALSWMALSMERLSEAKNKDVANDPAALRDFLATQEVVSKAAGVLAALLCVGESLQSDVKSKVETTKSTPKKPRKGNRNATKRHQG